MRDANAWSMNGVLFFPEERIYILNVFALKATYSGWEDWLSSLIRQLYDPLN